MPHYESAPTQFAPTSLPRLGIAATQRPPAASKPPMPPVAETASRPLTRRLGIPTLSLLKRTVDVDEVGQFLGLKRGNQ